MGIPWTNIALKSSRLLKRFGLNRRVSYMGIINCIAPDLEKALIEIKSRNPFLITSTGRTATKWLAALLHTADGACVVHEPVPNEQYFHVQAICAPETAAAYLTEFRLREMALRICEQDPAVYGEVNSALRFHIKALKELVPEFRLIHLVRDGRDVVRSVLTRRNGSRRLKQYNQLKPPIIDEHTARWDKLTEFEKVCWGWQCENRLMREHMPLHARFEDIVSSYELFAQQILEPLGLNIEKRVWESAVQRPANETKRYAVESWNDWPREQKDRFIRMCGKEMKKYGYDFN